MTTVFVTHDQEEAMEVADQIVVMDNGAVEQIGTPDELYDQPANDFVMSFLGPVTTLERRLVRPHDIEILADRRRPGAVPATVERLVRLGFEVRVDAVAADGEVWAQMTRGEARRLGLEPGAPVSVRIVGASCPPSPPPPKSLSVCPKPAHSQRFSDKRREAELVSPKSSSTAAAKTSV